MRRAARRGIGIAVTGAILAALGFLAVRALPGLIGRQAEELLREAGFRDVRVDVVRLGLAGAEASVRLDGPGQRVDRVVLGWSVDSIFEFELDSVELDGALLTLARRADGVPVLAGRPLSGGEDVGASPEGGIADVLARLPVRRISLHGAVLRLDGWAPYLPEAAEIGIEAVLERSGGEVRAQASGGGGPGTFSLDLAGPPDGRLEGVLRADPTATGLPGAPAMTVDVAAAEFALSVGPEGIGLATLRPLVIGFEGTVPGTVSVEEGVLSASGMLRREGGAVAFFPEQCIAVSARAVEVSGVSMARPKLCVGAQEPGPLLALPEEGGARVAATVADGELALPTVGPGVTLRGIRGRASFGLAGEGEMTAALEVPSLVLGASGGNGTPVPLAPLSLRADAQARPGSPVTLSGRIGGALSGRFSGRHDPATGKGILRVAADPMTLGGEGRPVAEVSPLLGRMVPDLHGTVGMKASLGWGPGAGPGRAEVLIGDAGLSAGGVALEGVNAVVEASSLFPLVLPPGQEVAVGAIDAGVPLTSGLVRFGMARPWHLDIQSASWDWAGGVLRAGPFPLDLEAVAGAPVLEAENVDLGRLLALLPVEGLSGAGTLAGVLPLDIEDGRVSVTAGRLAATGPGRLSYDPAEPPSFLSGGEQGTDLLLRAVTDFRYTSLDMTLDGTAGGELAVKLAISGSNPDFYDGYPVALTLNVSGALDTVLRRSLDAYRIPDAVRERMREFESSGE
jgi:Dicarboxylate transport